MSGHSKWSTIKRKKGIEDHKRGKLFTKLAKDITIAAKDGGGDATANPSLRQAIEKAKSSGMPKVNIDRAIGRGTGTLGGLQLVDAIYEGYGPGGVAILVKCSTDNKNRTVAEVRHTFTKAGYSLAEAGAVSYIFNTPDSKPMFMIDLEDADIEKFVELYDTLAELDDTDEVKHNASIDLDSDDDE